MELTTATSSVTDRDAIELSVCARPVDLVHLARYTLGNKALEREILDLFMAQGKVTLERLNAASTDKDWRDYAHALLGSARAIGAKRLADRVAIAQRLPGGPRDSGRPAIMTQIASELDAVMHYINELFPEE